MFKRGIKIQGTVEKYLKSFVLGSWKKEITVPHNLHATKRPEPQKLAGVTPLLLFSFPTLPPHTYIKYIFSELEEAAKSDFFLPNTGVESSKIAHS